MGKCPRCPWKGSAKAYQRHFATKHFKSKVPKGKVKTFKTPGFAKKRRR